jgi:hypothetical protein
MKLSLISLLLSVPLDEACEVLSEIDDGPDPPVLSAAPLLDLWQPVLSPQHELLLAGRCTGHPILGAAERWVVTSSLLGLAPDHSWARTFNRFYRLGRLAEIRGMDSPPAVRFPARCTVVPIDQLPVMLEVLSTVIRAAEGD